MPPVRRTSAAAQPPSPEVNFGDLGFYTAGGGFPEGNYALEFNTQMFQAVTNAGVVRGAPRLGVVVTAHSLTDAAAEPRTQFYSMGSQADKSFAPSANGKGIVPVAGAVGTSMNNSTNWAIFLKSLYDCGLPQGIFSNDLTVLDGIWVHTQNIPEPDERKGFGGSQTGEVAEARKAGTIAVVSEIMEDGKPWEGSGGFAEAPAEAPAVVARPKLAPKLPVTGKQMAGVLKAAAPPPVEEVDEDAVMTAAIAAATAVLEKSPNGVTKVMMRTGTFKEVNRAAGPEMAQTVINTFFGDDEALNGVLSQLGYKIVGTTIKPT